MNYRYEIHNRRYVRETREDNQFFIWSMKSLKSDLQPNVNYHKTISSFYRTKNWILQTYPELLL